VYKLKRVSFKLSFNWQLHLFLGQSELLQDGVLLNIILFCGTFSMVSEAKSLSRCTALEFVYYLEFRSYTLNITTRYRYHATVDKHFSRILEIFISGYCDCRLLLVFI
jgi:hypothetical protein